VETVSAELSLPDSDDVALYPRYFEQLWDIAEHGRPALQLPGKRLGSE
jgi:hypothetical protein